MGSSRSRIDAGDSSFMELALEEAGRAAENDEVPVGAVVVYKGMVVGRGHNRREALQRPTAHAEIMALEQASAELQSWRLQDCTLYVTLEPCLMCVGAIIQARVPRLVFGCLDAKAGAVESLYRACEDPRLNHHPQVTRGILENDCARVLSEFFTCLRSKKVNRE